ncbi:MAG: flavin reductase family protein [Bacteroidia bacterium]|nr:flavin reductase family protein [Bacteroidia bacterium]
MKLIDPATTSIPDLHQYLVGAVAPRPIAFVSTISAEGVPNLAPYSFFNVFSSNPPTLVFSSNRRVRGNTTKDTLRNAEETREVVVNVVNHAIVQQMSLASIDYPEEVSEFDKSGLTPVASELVKPFRVKESPVQMECRVRDIVSLGSEGGAGNLIICDILRMHIDEGILDDKGRIDPHKADLMGRMGRAFYVRASGEAVSTLVRPFEVLGIGFDGLPPHIRTSPILTGNDLAQLAAFTVIPAAQDSTMLDPRVMDILAGNVQDRDPQLHRYAQELIARDQLDQAWQVLLVE